MASDAGSLVSEKKRCGRLRGYGEFVRC
jgi:hypothetical protein